MHLLRYDSSFAFIAHAYIGYGDQRLAVDEADNAYLMARASAGAGFWALKFDRSGQTLNQIYQTALISTGNLRLGDYVADEQGGAIGSYSNNCTASYYRFFKMNVSGLVDFSLQLYSGTDCTYPIAKGFDLRGGTFAVGSLNQNYAVDFDPGPGVLSLPSGNDDGVVALYGWCVGAPYDPFGIDVLTSSWCVGDTVTMAVDAFGDASTYTWDPGTWNIAAGQGTNPNIKSVLVIGSLIFFKSDLVSIQLFPLTVSALCSNLKTNMALPRRCRLMRYWAIRQLFHFSINSNHRHLLRFAFENHIS